MVKIEAAVIILCLVLGISYFDWRAAAQKAERGTQQWDIDVHNGSLVHVVDTTGVCLYLALYPAAVGIAAVPKTQLPPGTGCQ